MPYAPGISFDSSAIGNGISQGLGAIANVMIQNAQKREEKQKWQKTIAALQPMLDQQTGGKIKLDKDTPKEAIPSLVQFAEGLDRQRQEKPLRDLQLQNEDLKLQLAKTAIAQGATDRSALRNSFDPKMAGLGAQLRAGKNFNELDPEASIGDPLAAYTAQGGADPQTLAVLGPLARQMIKQDKPMPGSRGFSPVEVPGVGTVVRDNATGDVLDGGKVVNKPKASKATDMPEHTADGMFYRSGPDDEWKPSPGASRTKDAADVTFDTNLDVAFKKLDEYKDTVEKFGNFESASVGNPKAAAALDQLPYNLAILTAKIVDPSSVAREGEVAAAQKYLLPAGLFKTNATTLASIENLRNTFDQYRKARGDAKGAAGRKVANSVDATPEGRASVANLYTDTDGAQYRIQTIKGRRGVMKGGKFYPIIEQ